MKPIMTAALLSVALAAGATAVAFGQATEDEIVKGGQFPLAAKAGEDSHAIDRAPPGALNQGKFDMDKWKYGHAWDAPAGAKIWNPVKIKMMQGGKVTGGTVFSATDPETYCAMANAGYDFIWTEQQHAARDWEDVAAHVARRAPTPRRCPACAWPIPTSARNSMRMDAGALVLVVPTVRSYEEAIQARDWAYFPPLGKRSQWRRPGLQPIWANVPGGYRHTINDNLVLILMIETLDGPEGCRPHRQDPGRHRHLRRQRRPGQFCRLQAGRSGL